MLDLRSRWLLAVAALLLGTAPALADIGPPVSVRLLGEPRPALPGQIYRGVMEITLDEPGELTNFRLEGRGWGSTAVDAPPSVRLGEQERIEIPFTAVPSGSVPILEFVFEYNGYRIIKPLDLSEKHYLAMTQGVAAIPADAGYQPPGVREGAHGPRPGPSPDFVAKAQNEPVSPTAYDIRVHGHFGYTHEIAAPRNADGLLVNVWHLDPTWELQATTTTDADGFYDVTFSWDPAAHDLPLPNILLWFGTINEWVDVRDGTFEYPYAWLSPITWSFAGNDLDVGWLEADDDTRPAAFILSTLTRAHRWLQNNTTAQYNLPSVGVVWPEGEGTRAWYRPSEQRIYLQSSDDPNLRHNQWNEGVQCHELGHHWQHTYNDPPALEYCNPGGYCDVPAPCGHCAWCEENEGVGFIEGFCNWFSPVITSTFFDTYGEWSFNTSDYEQLDTCQEDAQFHDPFLTEGFSSALLWDIQDSNQDNHDHFGSYFDALAMGPDLIFLAVDIRNVYTLSSFLYWYEWHHPTYVEGLWETAKNCGIDIDEEPPGIVVDLTSTSHVQGVPSTDSTVDLHWWTAPDDASGIAGYGYNVSQFIVMPPHTLNLGDVNQTTIGPLEPGYSYYFNIVAQDRDGRWSTEYDTFGPIVIEAPEPADLEFTIPWGWSGVLVPRPTGDAAPIDVPAPLYLPGNDFSTYWNLAGINSGEAVTSSGFWAHVFVDGYYAHQALFDPVAGGEVFITLNQGPISVKGGRHTFEARLDATETIAETDESNNRWAHQWVWTSLLMDPGGTYLRTTPPSRDGGWESVVDGSTLYNNCDGLRFHSSAFWTAVAVHALDNDVDYDCQLFNEPAIPTNGYDVPLAYATAPAGYLDAVVVNRRTASYQPWNVGVINSYVPAFGNYRAARVENMDLAIGDSVTVTYNADEMLRLWQFQVPVGGPWPLSITVETDPTDPVWAMYLDETFTYGVPNTDYDNWTTTLNDGRGRMDIPAANEGYHCLVVYRNPGQHTDPFDVTIEIQYMPPDFEPFIATGWWRPLVPRPAEDGTPTQVDQPDTLLGNVASTYFNLAIRNNSAAAAPFLHGNFYLDGVPNWPLWWGYWPADGVGLFNLDDPWIIPGGRHVLAVRLDDGDELEEIDEENNTFGDQYCWSPLPLSLSTPVVRSSPPDPTGNWEDVWWPDLPLWFNCDGMRQPTGTGWWKAVAVMPAGNSDVDVRYHEVLTGTKDGFGANLAYSGWGTGESDFVLVDFYETPNRALDAGVLLSSSVEEDYVVEAVPGASLYFTGDNVYGPWVLGGNHIMRLYTLYLTQAEPLSVELINTSGNVDWGISLYGPGTAYLTKLDILQGAGAWLAGPGQGETFQADIDAPDATYCLAVWKRDSASMQQDGGYQLHIRYNLTDATGDDLPTRTMLSSLYPNPFNPQVQIAFDLAQTSSVRLEIYDLQGRRVRVLVDDQRAPGRHEVYWDGRDDSGQNSASGIYFVRLKAGEVQDLRKVTLLK